MYDNETGHVTAIAWDNRVRTIPLPTSSPLRVALRRPVTLWQIVHLGLLGRCCGQAACEAEKIIEGVLCGMQGGARGEDQDDPMLCWRLSTDFEVCGLVSRPFVL